MKSVPARPSFRPWWSAVLRGALLTVAVLLSAYGLLLAWQVLAWPYLVYRHEDTFALSVQALASGHNPYAYAAQPAVYNMYGIGLPLATLPLVWLGINAVLAARLVAVMALGVVLAVTWRWSRRLRVPAVGRVVALAMVLALLLHDQTLAGMSSALGLACFVAALYWPWAHRFSWRSLVGCGLLILVAFYTKTYFVCAAGIVALYVFLRVSRRRGVLFGAGFAVALGASAALTDWLLPAYWDLVFWNTLYSTKEKMNVVHFIYSSRSFAKLTFSIPLLVLLYALGRWHRWRQYGCRWVGGRDLTRPMLRAPRWSYLALIMATGTVILFGKLGHNDGALLQYYNHLVMIFMVLAGASMLVRMGGRWRPLAGAVLVLANLLFLARASFPLSRHSTAGWEAAATLIRSARAPLVVDGPCVLATTHPQATYQSSLGRYTLTLLSPVVQQHVPRLYQQVVAADQRLADGLRAGAYDVVLYGPTSAGPGLPPDLVALLATHYESTATIAVDYPLEAQIWSLPAGYFAYHVYRPRAVMVTR